MCNIILSDIKEFIERTKTVEVIQEKVKTLPGYPHNVTYQNTDKGKAALRKGWAKRRQYMKEASQGLSEEEKQLIKKFYKNRPRGYHVDHILPISKGGLHRLANLQYLSIRDNRTKYNHATT